MQGENNQEKQLKKEAMESYKQEQMPRQNQVNLQGQDQEENLVSVIIEQDKIIEQNDKIEDNSKQNVNNNEQKEKNSLQDERVKNNLIQNNEQIQQKEEHIINQILEQIITAITDQARPIQAQQPNRIQLQTNPNQQPKNEDKPILDDNQKSILQNEHQADAKLHNESDAMQDRQQNNPNVLDKPQHNQQLIKTQPNNQTKIIQKNKQNKQIDQNQQLFQSDNYDYFGIQVNNQIQIKQQQQQKFNINQIENIQHGIKQNNIQQNHQIYQQIIQINDQKYNFINNSAQKIIQEGDMNQNDGGYINNQSNIQILQDFIELKNLDKLQNNQKSYIAYSQAVQSQIQLWQQPNSSHQLPQPNNTLQASHPSEQKIQQKDLSQSKNDNNEMIQQIKMKQQQICIQNDEKSQLKIRYISSNRNIKIQTMTFNIVINHQMNLQAKEPSLNIAIAQHHQEDMTIKVEGQKVAQTIIKQDDRNEVITLLEDRREQKQKVAQFTNEKEGQNNHQMVVKNEQRKLQVQDNKQQMIDENVNVVQKNNNQQAKLQNHQNSQTIIIKQQPSKSLKQQPEMISNKIIDVTIKKQQFQLNGQSKQLLIVQPIIKGNQQIIERQNMQKELNKEEINSEIKQLIKIQQKQKQKQKYQIEIKDNKSSQKINDNLIKQQIHTKNQIKLGQQSTNIDIKKKISITKIQQEKIIEKNNEQQNINHEKQQQNNITIQNKQKSTKINNNKKNKNKNNNKLQLQKNDEIQIIQNKQQKAIQNKKQKIDVKLKQLQRQKIKQQLIKQNKKIQFQNQQKQKQQKQKLKEERRIQKLQASLKQKQKVDNARRHENKGENQQIEQEIQREEIKKKKNKKEQKAPNMKKKKKQIQKLEKQPQQKEIYKKQASTTQQIGGSKPNAGKSNISQKNEINKSSQLIVPVQIVQESQIKLSKMIPILTSSMIIIEAEKERVGTTYKMFLKYLYQYDRTVSTHLRIIGNVYNQMQNKKNKKRTLMNILIQYFEGFSKLNRQYYEDYSKIETQSRPAIVNKVINIGQQLKKHYQQLNHIRKLVSNNCNHIDKYITNTVLINLNKMFNQYFDTILRQENKHLQNKKAYANRQNVWKKTISQIDKNFNKGLQRRQKEDLFKEIARMINQQKIHRLYLKNYGKGLPDLRHIYIKAQKQLFDNLQQLLNKYKAQSKTIYSIGFKQFNQYFDFINQIKTKTKFDELCTLIDQDYIKYVLQIHKKKEIKELTNKVFQNYLELEFFDKVVGNIKNLYKGAINKIFPLQRDDEELVHTISGNLIYFDKDKDLCHDKYVIKNINAKIIGTAEVQFDEVIKGIIFDDNRTARLKLKDNDRAQELICYLNEKQDDIIIESMRKL